MLKLRGFVSKVQAINAVLEKERNQMRVEKIQMAQNMAANIEESKKYKGEIIRLNEACAKESHEFEKKHQTEMEKIKNEYAGEIVKDYDEKLARLQKQYHEELLGVQKRGNNNVVRVNKERQDEIARRHVRYQSEIENKITEIRIQYENNLAEMKLKVRERCNKEFEHEMKRMKDEKSKVGGELEKIREGALKSEKEYKALLENKSKSEVRISAIKADFSNQVEKMEQKENEIKEEYGKCIAAYKTKENNLMGKFEVLNNKLNEMSELQKQKDSEVKKNSFKVKEINDNLKKELVAEKDNRVGFESEILSLKQKVQKMALQEQEALNQLQVEKDDFAENQRSYEDHIARQVQKMEEVAKELNEYKEMESKFTDRMKWAFKGGLEDGE